MLLLLSVLASSIAAAEARVQSPIPVHNSDWIRAEDYPPVALRTNEQGVIAYQLLISKSGQPLGCAIISPSKWSDLNQIVCPIILRRAHFKPASDRDGSPIYSTYVDRVDFSIPGGSYRAMKPRFDLQVSVNQLPAKLNGSPVVDAAVIVNSSGKIEVCQSQPSPASAELGNVACQQIAAGWSPHAILDEKGSPVRALVTMSVMFTDDSKGEPAR